MIPFFVASIVKRDVDFGEEPGPLSPLSALFFISQVGVGWGWQAGVKVMVGGVGVVVVGGSCISAT